MLELLGLLYQFNWDDFKRVVVSCLFALSLDHFALMALSDDPLEFEILQFSLVSFVFHT